MLAKKGVHGLTDLEASTLARVDERYTAGGEIVTDLVGGGKVACLLGGGSLLDERLDLGNEGVVLGRRGRVFRLGLRLSGSDEVQREDLVVGGDGGELGGGVGVPPMYLLAKRLIAMGKQVKVILGFNTKSEVFCEEDFRALGAEVTVTTVDGSYGMKGFVTDALKNMEYTYFYTCGPEPMLKAVHKASKTSGQMSFEERMGCGFGACMGCSCKTLTGYKRICKEGPVMKKEEILWEA